MRSQLYISKPEKWNLNFRGEWLTWIWNNRYFWTTALPANRNQFLIVVTNGNSKAHKEMPTSEKSSTQVGNVVLYAWAFSYGIPVYVQTRNEEQAISYQFDTTYSVLVVKYFTPTAYHSQTSGKVERNNFHMFILLQHFVSINLKNWDGYAKPLLYIYNRQVRKTTNTTPFSLVLLRSQPGPKSVSQPTS